MTHDWRARGLTGAFAVYGFMIAAFNRGFAYLHLDIGRWPLYSTEAFIGLIGLALLCQPSLMKGLWENRRKRTFTVLISVLLALTALKLALSFLPEAKIPDRTYVLRQSALGYYSVFGLFSLALLSLNATRRFFFNLLCAAAFVSTLITLFPLPERLKDVALFANFHALGAFLWMGIVSIFLLAEKRVDFWKHPFLTLFFLFEADSALLLGGRSVLIGLAACLALLVLIQWRRLDRRSHVSLGACLGIIIATLALQAQGIIRLQRQDETADSWRSWADLGRSFGRLGRLSREELAALTPEQIKGMALDVEDLAHKIMISPDGPPAGQKRELYLQIREIANAVAAGEDAGDKIDAVLPLIYQWKGDDALNGPFHGQISDLLTEISDLHEALTLQAMRLNGKVAWVTPIRYAPLKSRLHLHSNWLGVEAASLRYSNKVNNALWRLELWNLATRALFIYHPLLGFPFGTNVDYWAFSDMSFVEKVDFHNSHLAVLFRFGIAGLAVYAGLCLYSLQLLWKAFRRDRNDEALAYLIGLLFAACLASFNVFLEGPYCGPVFWGLLGAGIAAL